MITNKLQMTFQTEAQKKFTLNLPDAAENLSDAEVAGAMDDILLSNIFAVNGADLVEKASARMVSTTDFDLNA